MAKAKKPRIVHVECPTPREYRWLKCNARGATWTGDGFAVLNESDWSLTLAVVGGKEVV